jgi:WD40 repeat protein
MLKALPLKNNIKNWHSDWIWSVAFSPEGMMLASSGSDGQIIVWQVEDGRKAGPTDTRP